jgi:hypothetical protein
MILPPYGEQRGGNAIILTKRRIVVLVSVALIAVAAAFAV